MEFSVGDAPEKFWSRGRHGRNQGFPALQGEGLVLLVKDQDHRELTRILLLQALSRGCRRHKARGNRTSLRLGARRCHTFLWFVLQAQRSHDFLHFIELVGQGVLVAGRVQLHLLGWFRLVQCLICALKQHVVIARVQVGSNHGEGSHSPRLTRHWAGSHWSKQSEAGIFQRFGTRGNTWAKMAWPFWQLYRQHITCSPQVPSKETNISFIILLSVNQINQHTVTLQPRHS